MRHHMKNRTLLRHTTINAPQFILNEIFIDILTISHVLKKEKKKFMFFFVRLFFYKNTPRNFIFSFEFLVCTFKKIGFTSIFVKKLVN